ncbi:transposase [Micromonospora sp. WMMD975]|uniref:transposase n=1 Tax=Micromonospora sp. WMMD975 TaxID=3016087 RepID=UPI00249CDF79|nr:transposase [Micromonospora sp. WMMD975]WFE33668.1 transposase [Micromonospora sp. WMMD975]
MSREEDDAVALVRVYCGLASADPADRTASAETTLTSAVVDDAGRLLHVCEIGDEPAGYARLVALLVERSGGPSGAAIAADSDDHTVTSLLSAAGRPLAIADDDSVDDFAERFADDDSLEEMQSSPAERRAVGLARALQAGALSAVTLPAPRDLAGYKQVLSAHAALASGRHSAAVTLREVLRELYPAALRAYLDPAEPVALAVLDALPEPSMLTGAIGRGRDLGATIDAVAAQLAAEGLADADTVTEAVTALRVAVSETPRRATVNRVLTAAVAETVRQAVASVRACDAGCDALVGALAERATPVPAAGRRAAARRGEQVDELTPAAPAGLRPVRAPEPAPAAEPTGRRSRPEPDLDATDPGRRRPQPHPDATDPGGRRSRPEPVPGGRRSRPEPVSGPAASASPRPLGPPPVAPAPVAPPPVAPNPVTPVAPAAALGRPTAASPSRPEPTGVPLPSRVDGPTNRPVSAPPPPPPGITPIPPSQRGVVPPAEAGEPFRPTLTTAAINKARAERQRTVIPPRPKTTPEPPTGGFSATDLSIPVPSSRPPAPEAPPGSRANWPLVNNGEDQADREREAPAYPYGRGVDAPSDPGRVTPPWLADDLPQEPPMLRLVEPPPLADRALRSELDRPTEPGLDTPPLRLVDRGDAGRTVARAELPPPLERRPAPKEHRPPPVSDEGDGDLLIFAQARSAWFVGHGDEADLEWTSTADTGWQAAEQAARPAVGSETKAGLPKRVPQANLVPGSPLREERPLRIVRNAASLAENTTGYFRGWRRGQEIGGFAVGGRPGREAAGGWDFSRDTGDRDDEREFEYRSAGYRS